MSDEQGEETMELVSRGDPTPWGAAVLVVLGSVGVAGRALGGAQAVEAVPVGLALAVCLPGVGSAAAMAFFASRVMRRWGAGVGITLFAAVGAGAGVGFAVFFSLVLFGLFLQG